MGRAQEEEAEGGRAAPPPPPCDRTAGDPDLPQTLGPPAYAPYPSPVLSEEEDLLLDNPALEVSDSESDEALMAGPEGGASEAGKWEQVGRGTPTGGGRRGLKGRGFPSLSMHPSSEGGTRLCARGKGLCLPLCASPSCLYGGVTVTVTVAGVWEGSWEDVVR